MLLDAVCAVGDAPDAGVRELTQAMMVAWAETMVRGAGGAQQPDPGSSSSNGGGDAPPPPPSALRVGLDADGNVVAGVASFDAARALFASEAAARALLAAGSGGERLRVSTRLKNFSME